MLHDQTQWLRCLYKPCTFICLPILFCWQKQMSPVCCFAHHSERAVKLPPKRTPPHLCSFFDFASVDRQPLCCHPPTTGCAVVFCVCKPLNSVFCFTFRVQPINLHVRLTLLSRFDLCLWSVSAPAGSEVFLARWSTTSHQFACHPTVNCYSDTHPTRPYKRPSVLRHGCWSLLLSWSLPTGPLQQQSGLCLQQGGWV